MPVLCGFVVLSPCGKQAKGGVVVWVNTLDELLVTFQKTMREKPPGRFHSLEMPAEYLRFKMAWYLTGPAEEPAMH